MENRIRFDITVSTLYDLVQRRETNEVIIPPHQREYCWNHKKRCEFINSVLEGIPTQGIILCNVDNSTLVSLEDGQQRITTAQDYMNDKFVVPYLGSNKMFSELPERVKQYIRSYQLSVTTYRNATKEQKIRIFDRFQNGEPLSVGERLHSMTEISPIVKYAKNVLMNDDDSCHSQRIIKVFGNRSGEDKRRKDLTNAMAIVFGVAFGSDYITKKWQVITENVPELGGCLLSRPFDQGKINTILVQILEIYEEVDRIYPMSGKAIKNSQWAVGRITGYIIYSLTKPESLPFPIVKKKWVEFLVGARQCSSTISSVLHCDDSKARYYEAERWKMGYLRVFDPEEAQRLASDI